MIVPGLNQTYQFIGTNGHGYAHRVLDVKDGYVTTVSLDLTFSWHGPLGLFRKEFRGPKTLLPPPKTR